MNEIEITEFDVAVSFLRSRNLLSQYLKAKKFLQLQYFSVVDFKKRKPKSENIYQFRINKKFRALCYFEDKIEKKKLIVFKISDHQD